MPEVIPGNGWKQESPYGWSHASGWTIGRYVVSGVSLFMLWQGCENQGRFGRLVLAQQHHARLSGGIAAEKALSMQGQE